VLNIGITLAGLSCWARFDVPNLCSVLSSIADFIDCVQHKKQQHGMKRLVKLQGVLAGYDLDLSDFEEIQG
jgi:hypothetical protein